MTQEGSDERETTVEQGIPVWRIGQGRRDDFAELVEDFEKSAKASIDSYQEAGPREILATSVYCDARSGLSCWAKSDEGGIARLIVTGEELGAQKKMTRQRHIMGVQVEAVTKGRVWKSENLKAKKNPKPFEIIRSVNNLLTVTIPPAQDEGDKIQKKIDEENYEWFPVYITPPEINIVAGDKEPDPDLEMVKDLVTYAYATVADRLGAKADQISVYLTKYVEHMLNADKLGSRTDLVYSRWSFEISVKTKDGNNAFKVLRGAGTIKEVLESYAILENNNPSHEDLEPKKIISKVIDKVVKEAVDLDRAQTTSVIGASECPVILSAEVAGVLAHEVFGHTAEADIICRNRRKKDAGVPLKGRIGGQISEHPRLTMVDTPEKEIRFGDRVFNNLWGSLPVDGYGNKGKVATIIEKGTMTGVLVNRHTFNEIIDSLQNPEPIKRVGITGNVRREKFDKEPIIRMRNTFISPDELGPASKEKMAELIPATKKGLYVQSCRGGSVDPDSGNWQLDCNLCYLIENRTVTDKPVKNVIITGNIKQLNLIKAIGNSKTIDGTFPGWCGKDGQTVPVDGAGPIIYIEVARLGGGSYRPWLELVEEYYKQHREVVEGKRGPESINLPEFRELVGDRKPQNEINLITLVLPESEKLRYLLGDGDFATHERDENGKLIERRNRYE